MERHSFEKTTITHDEINALPLGAFNGKVVVVEDAGDLAKTFAEIIHHRMVGFDTETKPVFVRGHQNKVALMQIALQEKVFLIRINHTGLQAEIIQFLEDEHILKAGVALRDDIKALQRLKRFEPQGVVEL